MSKDEYILRLEKLVIKHKIDSLNEESDSIINFAIKMKTRAEKAIQMILDGSSIDRAHCFFVSGNNMHPTEKELTQLQEKFINSILENGYDVLWVSDDEFIATDKHSHYLYNIETWETSTVSNELMEKLYKCLKEGDENAIP